VRWTSCSFIASVCVCVCALIGFARVCDHVCLCMSDSRVCACTLDIFECAHNGIASRTVRLLARNFPWNPSISIAMQTTSRTVGPLARKFPWKPSISIAMQTTTLSRAMGIIIPYTCIVYRTLIAWSWSVMFSIDSDKSSI
jgi:hypothetical protein